MKIKNLHHIEAYLYRKKNLYNPSQIMNKKINIKLQAYENSYNFINLFPIPILHYFQKAREEKNMNKHPYFYNFSS